MKKSILFIILIAFFYFIPNVSASSPPYNIIVSGERLYWNSSNLDNTVTFTSNIEDNRVVSGTLTLNNYSGGQIELECVGSCSENFKFYINLIGDNKIYVPDDIGMVNFYNFEIIGDGTLTIISTVPIGNKYESTITIKIDSNKKELNNIASDIYNNKSKKGKININFIILSIIIPICIVSIIVAINSSLKLMKIKNNL